MMDVLSLVCVALVTFCVTVVGIAIYLTVIEHWKRQEERQEINQRLAEQVQRGRWTCRRCKKHYEGTLPMGPVCKHCWLALDEYLSEVA